MSPCGQSKAEHAFGFGRLETGIPWPAGGGRKLFGPDRFQPWDLNSTTGKAVEYCLCKFVPCRLALPGQMKDARRGPPIIHYRPLRNLEDGRREVECGRRISALILNDPYYRIGFA
jgi:hypothetical protein